MIKTEQTVIIARFQLKPNSDKQAFFDNLKPLFDTMSKEPTFVNGIVHENVDKPNEVVFYEIWNCSKETWLAEEESKSYRQGPYTRAAEFLLEESLVSTQHWVNGEQQLQQVNTFHNLIYKP